MAELTRFELAVSCVTGRHVRPLHHSSIVKNVTLIIFPAKMLFDVVGKLVALYTLQTLLLRYSTLIIFLAKMLFDVVGKLVAGAGFEPTTFGL
jgi:hypothetical protein